MGLTCATAHLFVGDSADGQSLLIDSLGGIGYELVESTDIASCDLVTLGTASWISLIDLESAGVATPESLSIAKAISATTKRPVVFAAVYDSDYFGYTIFHRGRRSDAFSSNEEFIPFSAPKTYPKKRADLWHKLFGTSTSANDVGSVAGESDTFADDQLLALCRILGIPANHAAITAADLSEFEFTAYRKSQNNSDVELKQLTGDWSDPKQLESLAGQSVGIFFQVDAPHSTLSNTIIEVSGVAIENGLLEFAAANGVWHCGTAHVIGGGSQRFDGLVKEPRSKMIEIEFPSLTAETFVDAPRPTVSLGLSLILKSVAEGTGEFRCRLRPDAQQAGGLDLQPAFRVHVGPSANWSPAGCADSHFAERAVRVLSQPRILSSVIILEDRPDTIAALRSQLERWLATRAWSAGQILAAEFEGQIGKSFKIPKRKATLSVAELPQSKKWSRFFSDPSKLQSLFVEMQGDTATPRCGVSLQRSFEDPGWQAEGTIQCGLWVDTDVFQMDEKAVACERDTLVEYIDEQFKTLPSIQAWIGHWNWIPRFDHGEERCDTPYEDAIAITGIRDRPNDFTDAIWCNQNLRSMGECLWLNESLLSFIDCDALAAVASLNPAGETAVRIQLRQDASLTQLETVMQPILPSRHVNSLRT